MCGKILKDHRSRPIDRDNVPFRIILGKDTNGTEILGDKEYVGRFTDIYMARSENLNTLWMKKGAFYIQTSTRIAEFTEGHGAKKLVIKLHETWDITVIASPDGSPKPTLHIVTRDSGLMYRKKFGTLPPLINYEIAVREHECHPRWPLYRRRVAA